MDHADESDPIIVRLREGFDRISVVLRAEQWSSAGEVGLNPSQAQVLGLLATRPAGLRPKEIAAHLAVSAASITDTLGALSRKGLVHREPDPSDARATIIRATPDGVRLGSSVSRSSPHIASALTKLAPTAQEELLVAQITLLRQLQLVGAIPVQRMCVSCRYFRPNAHPGEAVSHHCAFVDAPIGSRDLRLDCGEHEEDDPAAQTATWAAFMRIASGKLSQPGNVVPGT